MSVKNNLKKAGLIAGISALGVLGAKKYSDVQVAKAIENEKAKTEVIKQDIINSSEKEIARVLSWERNAKPEQLWYMVRDKGMDIDFAQKVWNEQLTPDEREFLINLTTSAYSRVNDYPFYSIYTFLDGYRTFNNPIYSGRNEMMKANIERIYKKIGKLHSKLYFQNHSEQQKAAEKYKKLYLNDTQTQELLDNRQVERHTNLLKEKFLERKTK